MAWIKLNATKPAANETGAENVHFRKEAGHAGTQSDPEPVSAFSYPVPPGGTEGQALVKSSDLDRHTEWADLKAGGAAVGYSIDPNPCLSQPEGQFKVNMAAVLASFPTKIAAYNAREFDVDDPDPGGFSPISIPPGAAIPIDSVTAGGGIQTIVTLEPHGFTTGQYVMPWGFRPVTGTTQTANWGPITKLDDYTFTQAVGAGVSGTAVGGGAYRGAVRYQQFGLPLAVAIRNGGANYVVADVIAFGGYYSNTARFRVTSVDGSGAVTGLELLTSGDVRFDSGINYQTGGWDLQGSGSGLTVDLTDTLTPSHRFVRILDINPFSPSVFALSDMDDASFDGTFQIFARDTVYNRWILYEQNDFFAVSGNGTLDPGAGDPVVIRPYFVTIYDPNQVGDDLGELPAFCELSPARVGVDGYTYMGAIYVTHDGGSDVIVTLGGWKTGGDARRSAGITIDGGGSPPATGSKGYVQIPFACTIKSWTMLADVSGSAQITVKKSTYSGFPTTTSIVASAPPVLSTAQKNTSSTLTGWTTAIAAGDIMEFVLDSVATISRLHLFLEIVKT